MTVTVVSRISSALDEIERDEDVRIVYACESGSRAWGFESADSDYDVRFLYVRPASWYLSIERKRDVIERPIDDALDLSGWDVPKALGLFRKSNPPLLEWLQSPIVYREVGHCASRMRELMAEYYSPISCMYHYLHMARGNNREFLQGETVRTKKYFYVLRPVLACLWIERGLGAVPTEFGRLVEEIVEDDALKSAITDLMDQKRAGLELDRGPRIDVISEFLDRELARLSAADEPPAQTRDAAALDNLLRTTVVETFGKSFER